MMNTTKIEEMREARAKLHAEMGEVLQRADAEGTLSAEDAKEYDTREQSFQALTDNIARLEDYDGLAPVLSQKAVAADARKVEENVDTEKAIAEATESREYAEAFDAYLRNNLDVEQRAALQVGTASEGGYTVAEEWHRQLVESEREFGVMMQLSTMIRTGDSGQLHIPAVDTAGTAALTAEEAAYTESEDTFKEIVLDSYKIGTLIKISDELLNDSIFDLAGFIARRAGQAIGIKANNYFVVGNGTGQPNGITVAASVGKTAASATAVTALELIDLFHSLLQPYRNRASWITKDANVASVRKLVETTNQFLWQPGLQAGQPDLLLGRPIYTDPDMPAMTTGLKSFVFGDISAYWIREVGGSSVKVLNELYAANGQVGYRVDRRLDGDLVDTAAVKTLAQA